MMETFTDRLCFFYTAHPLDDPDACVVFTASSQSMYVAAYFSRRICSHGIDVHASSHVTDAICLMKPLKQSQQTVMMETDFYIVF